MGEHNFIVIAELRDDLTEAQRGEATEKIEDLKRRLRLINIDEVTYGRKPVKPYDDFGGVAVFFCMLEDIKDSFKKLEYHDFWTGENKVAV